jgi:long-chain acyl-CoA synthetase
MEFTTVPEMFLQAIERFGLQSDKFAYSRKTNGIYKGISFAELAVSVESFAVGLLELGIKRGDRIGIVSENRLEWIIADLAITGIGAIDVPIFTTLTAKQEEQIFINCEATAIVVSNAFQLGKILKIQENMPSLRHVIVMNHSDKGAHPLVKSMDDVMQLAGSMTSEERTQLFREYAARVEPDDVLTLIYTSGTTGIPKGVILTNKNICANVQSCLQAYTVMESDIFLSYLPLCHSFERIGGLYLPLAAGSTVAFAESIEKVPENIREVRPTIMTSVPRLFEKIQARITSQIEKSSKAKQKIYHWAIGVGKKYIDATLRGSSPSLVVAAQYKIAHRLVFSKIYQPFGGRIRIFVSGGAPLNRTTAEFFMMVGFTILEGYGLTEASPVVSVNREGHIEIGTVGKPLANVEVKIADDGEILVRGENIMRGYWNDEASTRESINADGWLHTGDIGKFTEKGNLKITDRKKHLLVSSGGKNIAPAPIENLICQSRYIERCVLIGNNREFCSALIVPDYEVLAVWAKEHGLATKTPLQLSAEPDVVGLIQNEINILQKDVAKYERVRRFTLIAHPFTAETGELTPKLSIKRAFVEQKYASEIENMYQGFD